MKNALVEISQNVTTSFTTACDLCRVQLHLEIFATTITNFNYLGHFHNYDATIRNFIVLTGLILHLFSSINRLICPINHISHQIKVFYNDIKVYLNVCIKKYLIIIIIICIHMDIVHIMNLKINKL